MTRRQVAEYLGLCTRTVFSLELKGLLRRIQFTPRTIRYRRSDVERLIKEALV